MHKLLSFSILLSTCFSVFGQTHIIRSTPLGTWMTTDDQTGEVKSHIQIYEQDGKQYGRIIKLMRESLNHLCDRCDGYRKDKPMLGMVIIEDMIFQEGCWQNGRVLFPKQGKWYTLKYWLKEGDANTLVVRGSYGPFYRTQLWKRLE